MRYFEDFAVGQIFITDPQVVTRDDIIRFAKEFDPQPQHLGEDVARDSAFGELVASGLHTLSLSMQLMVTSGVRWAGAQGLGLDEIRWHRPLRPGEEVRVTVEVLELRDSRSRPDRGVARFGLTARNQDNEVMMTCFNACLLVRRPVS